MPEIQVNPSLQKKPLPAAKDLKFGQLFTDNWFFSKFSEDKGWYDSRVEAYGAICLDPAASVFHYGQALFEGMKAFRQPDGSISLFRPEFNYQRLCDGAARLCLHAPPAELFMQGLKSLLQVDERWVPSEDGCSLYIRPTLIGTEGFLGVRPAREVLFYVLLSPVGGYYSGQSETVRIWVEDKALRAAPGGLGATKAGANYAASLQAGLMARQKGYAQVLWLDTAHEGIEEVGTMNVFFVLNDEIVTPALNGSILPGCVRDTAIQLLKAKGLRLNERRITISEIAQRHQRGEVLEAFGTGTAAVISPIGELAYRDHKMIIHGGEIGPVAKDLKDTITGIHRGRIADPFGWMKPVMSL